MPIRKLTTSVPRSHIEAGDYMSAFARVSADLEMVLFDKLFFEKGIKAELMERWSLYTFIQWNIKSGLVEAKWEKLLNEFRIIRNKVVHGRVFLVKLEQNPQELKYAKSLLHELCNFIDQIEIVYKRNPELEQEYGKLERI